MRKTVSVILVLGLFIFGLHVAAQCQGKAAIKLEMVEKTGIIEVQAPAKGQKYSTVLLKVDKETFKLIPDKRAKGIMRKLEAQKGNEVTVKGTLLPADAKYPLPAIKVSYFSKSKVTPAATPAPKSGDQPQGFQ